MTKNHDAKYKKEPSEIAKMAEEFPSPPKKDGTKDPENILAKKRREKAEKALEQAWGNGKKGANKAGDGSGGGKKG